MANEFIARNGVIALNNSQVTGSLSVTGGITGSFLGSASFATTSSYAISSSFATSASYAPDTTFPYTGSAIISGSLVITGSVSAGAGYFNTSSVNQIGIGPLTGTNSIFNIIGTSNLHIANNSYYNASFLYTTAAVTSKIQVSSGGSFVFSSAPQGIAGAAVTYTDVLTVNNSGSGYFAGNVIVTGSVTATGGGFDSDLTLKNVLSRDLSLYYIANEVSPLTYTWKDETKGKTKRFGYGAQELQTLIPEAVYQNGGTLAVDYTQVHTVLIDENTKRIQELEKQVTELKNIINGLDKSK